MTKKANVVYALVKDLRNKKCGIDGVGFQSHWALNDFKYLGGVAKNMKRYEKLGVKVHFTEVDVRCQTDPGFQKRCLDGHFWDDNTRKQQANFYYKLLRMCLKAPNCEAFQIWGVSDKQSNLRQDWVKHDDPSNANPMPFNWYYHKKPAYWAMRDLLRKYSKKVRKGRGKRGRRYRAKKWYRHNMK